VRHSLLAALGLLVLLPTLALAQFDPMDVPPPPLGDGELTGALLPLEMGLRIDPLYGTASWAGVFLSCTTPGAEQALRISWHSAAEHPGILGAGFQVSVEERLEPGVSGMLNLVEADGFESAALLDGLQDSPAWKSLVRDVVNRRKELGLRADRAVQRALSSDPEALRVSAEALLDAGQGRWVPGDYASPARGGRWLEVEDAGATLRLPGGAVHRYDEEGRLVERRAAVGPPVVVEWEEGSRRPSVQRKPGCEDLGFIYDGEGRLSQVAGPGGVLRVDYGNGGRVAALAGPSLRVEFEWRDDGLRVLRSGGREARLSWRGAWLEQVKLPGNRSLGIEETFPGPAWLAARVRGPDVDLEWRWDPVARERRMLRNGQLAQRIFFAVIGDRPVRIEDGAGRVVELEWDSDGGLVALEESGLRLERAAGPEPAWLTSAGQRSNLSWAGGGRLTRGQAGGAWVRIERDLDGLERRVSSGDRGWSVERERGGSIRRVMVSGRKDLVLDRDRQGRLAGAGSGILKVLRDGRGLLSGLEFRGRRLRVDGEPGGAVESMAWTSGGAVRLELEEGRLGRLEHPQLSPLRPEWGRGGLEGIAALGREARLSRGPEGWTSAIDGPLGLVSLGREASGALTGWSLGGASARLTWDAGWPSSLSDPVVGSHAFGFVEGRLRSWEGPSLGRTEVAWGEDGAVAEVVDPWGERFRFGRSPSAATESLEGPLRTVRLVPAGERWRLEAGAATYVFVADDFGSIAEILRVEGAEELPVARLSLADDGLWAAVSDDIGRRFPRRHEAGSEGFDFDRSGRVIGIEVGRRWRRVVRDVAGRWSGLQEEGRTLLGGTVGPLGLVRIAEGGGSERVLGRDAFGRLILVRARAGMGVEWGAAGRVTGLNYDGLEAWVLGRDLAGELSTMELGGRGRLIFERDRQRGLLSVRLPSGERILSSSLHPPRSMGLRAEPLGAHAFPPATQPAGLLRPGMSVEDLPEDFSSVSESPGFSAAPQPVQLHQAGLPLVMGSGDDLRWAVPDPRGSGSLGRLATGGDFELDPWDRGEVAAGALLGSFLAEPTLAPEVVPGLASPAPLWAESPEPGPSLDLGGPTVEGRGLLLPVPAGFEEMGLRGLLALLGLVDLREDDPRVLVGEPPVGPRVRVPAVDLLRGLALDRGRGGLQASATLGIAGYAEPRWTLEPRLRGAVMADPAATLGMARPWTDPLGPLPLTRLMQSWDGPLAHPCGPRRMPVPAGAFGIDEGRGERVRDALLCAAARLDPINDLLQLDPLRAPVGRVGFRVPLAPGVEARIDGRGRLRSVDVEASATERWNRATLAAFVVGWSRGDRPAEVPPPPYLPSLSGAAPSAWGLLPDDPLLPVDALGAPAPAAFR
jgi:hypothetical protein